MEEVVTLVVVVVVVDVVVEVVVVVLVVEVEVVVTVFELTVGDIIKEVEFHLSTHLNGSFESVSI